jgi:hypothetical protein
MSDIITILFYLLLLDPTTNLERFICELANNYSRQNGFILGKKMHFPQKYWR